MEKDKNYAGFFLMHMIIPVVIWVILENWTKNVSGGDLAVIGFVFIFGLLQLMICVIGFWHNSKLQNHAIWGCLVGNTFTILLSIGGV